MEGNTPLQAISVNMKRMRTGTFHSLKITLPVVLVSHDLFWHMAPTSPLLLFMVNKSPDPPFQTTTASKLPISSPAELKANM